MGRSWIEPPPLLTHKGKSQRLGYESSKLLEALGEVMKLVVPLVEYDVEEEKCSCVYWINNREREGHDEFIH